MLNPIQRSVFLAFVLFLVASPASANAGVPDEAIERLEQTETSIQEEPAASIPHLSELERPATTVADWLAQSPAPVQITGVQLDSTPQGIALRLETAGESVQPAGTSVVGNALIVNIDNATLALPEGEEFQAINPAEGIALVSVTTLPNNRVRVAVTGSEAPPTAEIGTEAPGVLLSITPGAAGTAGTADESIQIVATGEQEEDYAVDDATTATRTDTPLRDIPQSIQIVPRQIIEDQQVNRVSEALRNVSGVQTDDSFGGTLDRINIRGFQADVFLENGFRRSAFSSRGTLDTALIDRIEVLKGPASVLFGNLEPGGVVNIITESPLPFPQYSLEGSVGSFGFLQPSIDLTGPLNEEGTVLYRINALYERNDGFRDYDRDVSRVIVAPSLLWNINDRTSLAFDIAYGDDERPFDRGIPAIGDGVADIPRERILQDRTSVSTTNELAASYRFQHRFSENWTLNHGFRFVGVDTFDFRLDSAEINDSGVLQRTWRSNDDYAENYSLQTNIVGEFSTGSIEHTLLFGVDFDRATSAGSQRRLPGNPSFPINIFTGESDTASRPELSDLTLLVRNGNQRQDSVGFYLQDQIAFTDNLKLLLGGRFDLYSLRSFDALSNTTTEDNLSRFTPRIGIVYQPIEEISLYTSYSQAFNPNTFDQTVDGELLEPETSEQFEVGVRGEFLDGRLIANLAAYEITKQNIAAPDPADSSFSIGVGEIRSRGIELDVAGEILPGWNVIASYAYTDAEVTEASFFEEGNRPDNVAEHSGSFWTTYEIQQGSLEGLGFGLGLFLVGDRFGDFENTYTLPGYVRADAAIYYRRNNWRAALNFQNLLDEDYIRYSEGYREANTPGDPFTVVGSIAITF
ncbi:TonB-dependent siderophore receptor [Leptolyngbya ohadii]|uniref:TonB-dependent siderophore receptor n=1 Tax=Leptolyngbya ohadii TaxID=1962290 RepID=UPI0019D42383|nr:TonB-dependent siderophore receptor [Leptolyngbya ohadii]